MPLKVQFAFTHRSNGFIARNFRFGFGKSSRIHRHINVKPIDYSLCSESKNVENERKLTNANENLGPVFFFF